MPALLNAERVVVAALGKEKAAAIRDALDGDAVTPFGIVVKKARNTRILLDEEAAGLLMNRLE